MTSLLYKALIFSLTSVFCEYFCYDIQKRSTGSVYRFWYVLHPSTHQVVFWDACSPFPFFFCLLILTARMWRSHAVIRQTICWQHLSGDNCSSSLLTFSLPFPSHVNRVNLNYSMAGWSCRVYFAARGYGIVLFKLISGKYKSQFCTNKKQSLEKNSISPQL